MNDWQRRSGSIEEIGGGAGDDAPFACPLCGEADRPGGPYCSHVVFAFEPRIAPEHRGGADEPRPHCLARFRFQAAPAIDDVERLCALVGDYARRPASDDDLPQPLAALAYFVRERERETGDGLYTVTCSALDYYLGRILQECPGFAGGEAIERSNDVLYRVFFAGDPLSVGTRAAARMARDSDLLESRRDAKISAGPV